MLRGVLGVLFAVASFSTLSPREGRAAELLRLRHSTSARYTRIVVDLSEMPKYEVFASGDSARLLVDLLEVHLGAGAQSFAIGDGIVDEVLVHDVEEAGVQVEIRLNGARRSKVFTVPAEGGKPDRIVVDVLPMRAKAMVEETAQSPDRPKEKGSKEEAHRDPPHPISPALFREAQSRAEPKPETPRPETPQPVKIEPDHADAAEAKPAEPTPKAPAPEHPVTQPDAPPPAMVEVSGVPAKDSSGTRRPAARASAEPSRVVVLDPGHGGNDPGATGLRGLIEKDVALRAVEALKAELESKDPSLRVLLTRNTDDFVPLRARYRFAEAQEADLFVSLHTNAAADKRARGAEIYFLTLNSTSADAEASRLAEMENAADLIGAVPHEAEGDLVNILADMQMKDTLTRSSIAADALLSSLGRQELLKTRSVEQAGFLVLRSPRVPSVLVELGFLTNTEDARLLEQPDFYERLASALAEGILAYLGRAPAHEAARSGS